MKITEQRFALCFTAKMKAVTGLLLRSGRAGEFTDSAVETTGDGRLHINGYVWASLLLRALGRCEKGKEFAAKWGKYKPEQIGVAPLWIEAAFLAEKEFVPVVNPGNRIDRKWGSTAESALYSDELAYPLVDLPLQGTIFFQTQKEADVAVEALRAAFWVINQGIETIGGGWSYGFGRLKVKQVRWSVLDLQNEDDRKRLWQPETENCRLLEREEIENCCPEIAKGKGWSHLQLQARIMPGQMLAIHTDVPELGVDIGGQIPDNFVFTRPQIRAGKPSSLPVITGKAFRQAVLSREIERRLRSRGEGACLNSSDPSRLPVVAANKADSNQKRRCLCKRCLWFGDVDAGGIIAVGDALVENSQSEIINRIQVCEHSRQTMQNKLFNGEYLTRGDFSLDVLIDHSREQETASRELIKEISSLLAEMTSDNNNAPPGWYRLGATSTCTGQLEIKQIVETDYGCREQ